MTTSNEPTRLTDLLRRDVILEAPVFQRRFSWKDKQLTDFWDDFDAVREPNEDETLFMGAIILRHEAASTANSAERWLIIDGQQRLTTLSLAILAICLEARNATNTSPSDVLTFITDQVKRYLLPISSGNIRNSETKVMVTTPDLDDYRHVLALASIPEVRPFRGKISDSSRVTRTLVFHREQIGRRIPSDAGLSAYEALINELVMKIELVEIHLSERHDPNEVFNRLNTKGQALTLGDLVRNEAFSRFAANRDAANHAYKSDWRPFEERFDSDASRDAYYWPFTLARMPTATKGKAFSMLRERWKGFGTGDDNLAMKQIVEDLGSLADEFKLVHDGVGLKKLAAPVRATALRLHRMNLPTVTYCFVLLILESAQNGTLSAADATASLGITESFLVRRALIGLEPTGLHAVFKRLWGATKGNPSKVRKELDRATIYFPDDAEVRKKLPSVNMYKRRLSRFILGEYERSFTSGDPLSEEQLTKFEIDHAAPQSLAGRWVIEYSKAREEIDRVINSWGNLVPLSSTANSSKGASTWEEARTKLRLETIYSSTKRLMDEHETWTPSNILERTNSLTEWALLRWPDLGTKSDGVSA